LSFRETWQDNDATEGWKQANESNKEAKESRGARFLILVQGLQEEASAVVDPCDPTATARSDEHR